MKKTLKLLTILASMALIASCSNQPSKEQSKPVEESSAAVIESSEPAAESSQEPDKSESKPSSQTPSSSAQASSSKPSSAQPSSSKPSSAQSSSAPAGSGSEVEGNFTFDENQLNTPQDIHTTNQNKYLNFAKPYYHITGSDLDGFSATGKTSLQKSSWAPKSVTVSWDYTAPAGKTLSKFQFLYGQSSDLSDAYTVEGTTAKSVSFVNPYLGDNYFKVVANFSDGSKEASPIKIFKVTTQAPRNLDVGSMPNVRDTGGRTTYAGGKIKQGLIFRTAGSSGINSEAKDVLTKQLKVKTEINVADSTSYNCSLSGTKVVNAFMAYGSTPYSNLARNSTRIRQVMELLADINNYPVFYHCRIGTDRTGITAVMINGLLGVPFNEVIQDYGFSNFSPIDNQRYPGKTPDSNGDDIRKYIDELLAMPGKNFQEQTYHALLSIGCKAETLNTIIDIMTEGNKAEIAVNGVVGEGNALTTTGNKKTSTDYKSPATYYELSSGKSVTLNAELSAGEKDIVVYLGGTDANQSTKFANCVSLKIDGVEQTITNTKTLHTAGFGNTGQDSRMGYMFNILGKYNLTAGTHTITFSVKSGSFNLGTLAAYDHVANTTDTQYM